MTLLSRIVALIAWAAVCNGQALAPASWNALESIQPQTRIRVETAKAKHNGTFVRSSEQAIELQTKKGPISVPRTEVAKVYSQSGSKRLRNSLIGAAIGAGVGIASYATYGRLLQNEGQENTGAILVIPIGIGAGIGAAIPSRSMKKVYEASGP